MFILVHTTTGSKREAEKIAKKLVKEKIVACANYFPVHSTYRWNGEVVSEMEYSLSCKTTKKNFPLVKRAILSIHSYDLPAIVSIPINGGSSDYLHWITGEVI